MRLRDLHPQGRHRIALPLFGAVVLVGCQGVETGEAASDPELGHVDFPTSCSAEAQVELERGLALLHHMMYVEAEGRFGEAARIDEECAMAHWGIAMTQFQPLWPGQPAAEALETGRSAAERALALDPPTERERAYVRTALAFHEDVEAAYSERLRRWEAATEELHRSHPDDQEAAALYALAHLSLDPADGGRQETAAALLEAIHEEEPRHPGAVHYAIHVHDVERRAQDGVEYADAYDEIAPSVPHALHMPSHIYVRLGEWEDVIDWNRRSADAALEFPAGEHVSHHYPHALDYLMYGHLQRGEDDEAREVLGELGARESYQPTFISAYALAAVPARWYVERRDWEGASELEPRVPERFPWEEFPGAEAMTHFAMGLGAARTGDAEAARRAVGRLDELEAAASEAGDEYWARQIRVQRESVSAWVALSEGRTEPAVGRMRGAAELAQEMEKHPVTPGALQPAWELLGDLLMEAGRPVEALDAYETSLGTWPRRYHSLLGAARAAEGAAEEQVALRYYQELAELTGDAPAQREGVVEARERVADG